MSGIARLLVAALTFTGLAVLGSTSSADAAVSCNWRESGHFKFRNCAVGGSRYGGTIDGLIGWTVDPTGGGDGTVNIYVDDRPSVGCLALRIRYRGGTRANETVVQRVCGGGAKNVVRTLNQQYLPFSDGVFLVDWCESDTKRSALERCINLWSQRVDDEGPDL